MSNIQILCVVRGEVHGPLAFVTDSCVRLLNSPIPAPSSKAIPTTGALDLGGASTQISFVSDSFDGSESPSNSVLFRLYGSDYNLYTHSFLCYGKDQALKMVLASQIQVGGSLSLSFALFLPPSSSIFLRPKVSGANKLSVSSQVRHR